MVKSCLKSTSPKTKEGKARSKMNALKVDPELYVLIKAYNELMEQQKCINAYLL